ncbi:MAG: hypothetical protein OQJ97_01720 [Rhodospirillales bacterium]|nr:hypothetical protein [Rhodospirillales bacterium]
MDYMNHLERIYENLEEDKVELAVMACLRIARISKDYLNAAYFFRELYPNKKEVARFILDDTSHLKKDAYKFILETSFDRWINTRTLEFSFPNEDDDYRDEEQSVLLVAVGEIDSEIEQCDGMISDLQIPQGMGEFDTAAFTDHQKNHVRLRRRALQTIRSRIRTRCLSYSIQIENQLNTQSKNQKILETVQNEVNNYYKSRSKDIYEKLHKAATLATSTDPEDSALLLTEVRRGLKAVADYYFPPVHGMHKCIDGMKRQLGEEQYLNRLQEFLAKSLRTSASKELLESELEYLVKFIRRLNNIASKGVHSSVTLSESRQGLIGLYFSLFNISQYLNEKEK